MDVFICIVRSHRHVEDILTGFLEIGIRGASVIDVQGMGEIISTSIPIFAGFKSLFPVGGGHTYLIMSVLDEELLQKAERIAEEVCGDFSQPGTGLMFSVPVKRVKGVAKEIS